MRIYTCPKCHTEDEARNIGVYVPEVKWFKCSRITSRAHPEVGD
jgi:hypothetical protein